MSAKKKITINEIEVTVVEKSNLDYISLTDMARFRDPNRTNYIVQNWLRTRYALEFCGLWEKLHNPVFKGIEFDAFKNEAGSNAFVMTPKKWIQGTNAIGIISKPGRFGGGTLAHKDIAFEFGTWLSPEFKLYLIREFQRLKEDESKRIDQEWNIKRMLAKVNYRIHTDAVQDFLIPAELTRAQINAIYASEADLLNMALFGMTAKQWRDSNPDKKGNLRDHATIEQLVVLSNLESLNAVFIEQGVLAPERMIQLNTIAIAQMTSLLRNPALRELSIGNNRVEESRPIYGKAS